MSDDRSATLDGTPETAADSSLRQDTELLGAARVLPRGPLPWQETAVEKVRNALTWLQIGRWAPLPGEEPEPVDTYRVVDVQRVKELLHEVVVQLETERSQVERNLERALAEIRLLRVAIAAPQPRAIVAVPQTYKDEPVFLVSLSDGSVKLYRAGADEGERWVELEPIPGTRSGLLAGAGK